ncbi:myb-like protein O [Nematostella vectensis]|uniref:myb-like protein O n=1 Tax=Nematostella vectensis TaxID=45351 RepID=UPI00207723F5|nr:myb-like protein O [Nematostella vectensis]
MPSDSEENAKEAITDDNSDSSHSQSDRKRDRRSARSTPRKALASIAVKRRSLRGNMGRADEGMSDNSGGEGADSVTKEDKNDTVVGEIEAQSPSDKGLTPDDGNKNAGDGDEDVGNHDGSDSNIDDLDDDRGASGSHKDAVNDAVRTAAADDDDDNDGDNADSDDGDAAASDAAYDAMDDGDDIDDSGSDVTFDVNDADQSEDEEGIPHKPEAQKHLYYIRPVRREKPTKGLNDDVSDGGMDEVLITYDMYNIKVPVKDIGHNLRQICNNKNPYNTISINGKDTSVYQTSLMELVLSARNLKGSRRKRGMKTRRSQSSSGSVDSDTSDSSAYSGLMIYKNSHKRNIKKPQRMTEGVQIDDSESSTSSCDSTSSSFSYSSASYASSRPVRRRRRRRRSRTPDSDSGNISSDSLDEMEDLNRCKKSERIMETRKRKVPLRPRDGIREKIAKYCADTSSSSDEEADDESGEQDEAVSSE